jgi:hypothetical protein
MALNDKYDRITNSLNRNIKGLKAHSKILITDELQYLHPVYEKAIYIAISLSDLNIGLKYIDISDHNSNEIEKIYFSRVVALTLFELVDSQKKVVSREVKDVIMEKIGNKGFCELKQCSKNMSEIKNNHHKKLKFIRNNLFGHREANGAKMAIGMLGVDEKEVYDIGREVFSVYLNTFTAYMNIIGKI